MLATAKARCSSSARHSASWATTSATRRSTATRTSSTGYRRPPTRSSSCARSSGSRMRSLRRSTGRCRSSSRPRSTSRKQEPTRNQRTRSRTSMPELSYREAVRDALSQAMRNDEDVFIMGEDIAEMGGSMGVTQGMLDEFGPERVRNTPISEMAIVGSGIGAAMQGMRPVVEVMYEDFLTISMEQIVNQAAKHRYMSGGQLRVPLTMQPLDEDAIVASVKKTNRCVVAHEAVTRMGFGAEVAAVVQHQAFDWLDAPVERVGAKFAPLPFAPVMEEYVVPHAKDVLEAIQRTVQRDS